MTQNYSIGIDLGTTHCCMAVWNKGRVEIIPNSDGDRKIPSYVSFTDSGRMYGTNAMGSSGLFDIKRLMGKCGQEINSDRSAFSSSTNHWPYEITTFRDRIWILVDGVNKLKPKLFAPEEISAMILSHLKTVAENYLGGKVLSAVITVPAHFTDAQRTATKNAAHIAGIEVMRLVAEPTAAALAFGFERIKSDMAQKVLIYDLGGGSLDVSLLDIDNGFYKVLATAGDTRLGGQDFTNRMISYCLEKFKNDNKINPGLKEIQVLRKHCENAKKLLSEVQNTTIQIDGLYKDYFLCVPFTRDLFVEINKDLFERLLNPVHEVLKTSQTKIEELDHVVLVGACTRVPKILEILSQFFVGKVLNRSINPDEAVAYGAAIQAALLSGSQEESLSHVLLNVVPFNNLSVHIDGTEEQVVLHRNQTIPVQTKVTKETKDAKFVEIYEKCEPVQSFFQKIFPGSNKEGGKENLIKIPLGGSNNSVEVFLDIDANGTLQVTVNELPTGTQYISVLNTNSLSKEQIEQMIQEAHQLNDEDWMAQKIVEVRETLEQILFGVQRSAGFSTLPDTEKKNVANILSTIENWLMTNPKNLKEIEDKISIVTDLRNKYKLQ